MAPRWGTLEAPARPRCLASSTALWCAAQWPPCKERHPGGGEPGWGQQSGGGPALRPAHEGKQEQHGRGVHRQLGQPKCPADGHRRAPALWPTHSRPARGRRHTAGLLASAGSRERSGGGSLYEVQLLGACAKAIQLPLSAAVKHEEGQHLRHAIEQRRGEDWSPQKRRWEKWKGGAPAGPCRRSAAAPAAARPAAAARCTQGRAPPPSGTQAQHHVRPAPRASELLYCAPCRRRAARRAPLDKLPSAPLRTQARRMQGNAGLECRTRR